MAPPPLSSWSVCCGTWAVVSLMRFETQFSNISVTPRERGRKMKQESWPSITTQAKKIIIIIKMWSWLVLHVSTLGSVPTTAGGGKVLKSVTCCWIQVSLNRPSLDGTAEFSENTHALLHPLRTAKLHRHSGRWRWDLHSPSVCLVWLLRKSFHARPVIDSSHVMLTQFWSKLVWPGVCTATTQRFNMVHTTPRPPSPSPQGAPPPI